MEKNESKKEKFARVLRAIFKVIDIKTLIILIVLLAANTFAWFIYTQKVGESVSVHVRGWNVAITYFDKAVTDYVNVDISDVYPGMDTEEGYSLDIKNDGEVTAEISYTIVSAFIFGDQYYTKEGKILKGERVKSTDISEADLYDILDDYPFTISFNLTKQYLSPDEDSEDNAGKFYVDVVWPYESGNDELDTYWGEKAYKYSQENPGTRCMSFVIQLSAKQLIDEDESTDSSDTSSDSSDDSTTDTSSGA